MCLPDQAFQPIPGMVVYRKISRFLWVRLQFTVSAVLAIRR